MTAAKGHKKQYTVKAPHSPAVLPVTEITGTGPGPVFLITAGIHGGEYPGIAASLELAALLRPEDIAGKVILIHAVNQDRLWERRTEDNGRQEENLNRAFPGNPEGTPMERLAHFLTENFIRKADFYADCHSGDIHEDLCAHTYYPKACREEVSRLSREMAFCTDVPYIVPSHALSGAYNSAAAAGIPSVLIEHGGNGLCLDEDIRAFRNDLLRLLRRTGLLQGNCLLPEPMRETPREVRRVIYPEADRDCFWRITCRPGDFVRKGDSIGYTTDFFGSSKTVLTAEEDGVILCLNSSLALPKHNFPVFYAVL